MGTDRRTDIHSVSVHLSIKTECATVCDAHVLNRLFSGFPTLNQAAPLIATKNSNYDIF